MRYGETRCWFGSAMFAALLSANLALADGQSGIPMVIADFDYYDTSGEVRDQTVQHSTRVQAFASLLRDNLADQGKYTILRLNCPESTCSAGSMAPDELVQAARQAGARLLVYGGIHKMSTLVQWGKVQVVDLAREELLLDRLFSFRGDTDTAFRRAAKFVVETLESVTPKP